MRRSALAAVAAAVTAGVGDVARQVFLRRGAEAALRRPGTAVDHNGPYTFAQQVTS